MEKDSCTYPLSVHLDCAGGCLNDEDYDGICDWNDGDSYATVLIGGQEWMAENLKVTHYQNGEEIRYIQRESVEPNKWENIYSGAYGYYNDNPLHLDTFGNFYNWYAISDKRGICPEGWHVPTDNEWTILSDYLGGINVAGAKMTSY